MPFSDLEGHFSCLKPLYPQLVKHSGDVLPRNDPFCLGWDVKPQLSRLIDRFCRPRISAAVANNAVVSFLGHVLAAFRPASPVQTGFRLRKAAAALR